MIKLYKIMKGNKVVVNQTPQYVNEEAHKILSCKAENFCIIFTPETGDLDTICRSRDTLIILMTNTSKSGH